MIKPKIYLDTTVPIVRKGLYVTGQIMKRPARNGLQDGLTMPATDGIWAGLRPAPTKPAIGLSFTHQPSMI